MRLTIEEAAKVDDWMGDHMTWYAVTNNPNQMTCDRECRIAALQKYVNKALDERPFDYNQIATVFP